MAQTLERELGDGGDLLTSALARAAALARARSRCRGVLAPTKTWRRPDGVVAAAFQVAPGASLAEAPGPAGLSVGECVTVGVGVAEALAAMHAQRVAHGDVSPANVVVSGRRVTLVDTMGALSEERGTPGFAAPERARGASPAADVYALGSLLRALADERAAPIMAAWTAPLLVEDPRERPTAAHAAAALARCAPGEPVRAPSAPVAAAMRASAVERTLPHPRDRWWRLERRALRLSPLAALAVVAAASGIALVPAVAAAPQRIAPPHEPALTLAPVPVAELARAGPEEAAERLAATRVNALAHADAAGLRGVSLPGSSAASADAALAAGLDDEAFDGLELLGVIATVERVIPGGAVVTVTTTLSDYGVGQGARPGGTATARLELALTQRGWFVARILPPA